MRELINWFVLTMRSRKEGATAVEYALIVAGIAVVIIVAVFALGGQLQTAFENIGAAIGGAGGGEG